MISLLEILIEDDRKEMNNLTVGRIFRLLIIILVLAFTSGENGAAKMTVLFNETLANFLFDSVSYGPNFHEEKTSIFRPFKKILWRKP